VAPSENYLKFWVLDDGTWRQGSFCQAVTEQRSSCLALGAWWWGFGARQFVTSFRLAVSRRHQAVWLLWNLVVALISGLEVLSSLTFVFGLDGLSPIGVWDVLGGGTHDGHGTG